MTSARVTTAAFPAPGFADPARDAQRAFRAVLNATANPTTVFPLAGPDEPPAALGRGLAAVALTLLDEDCSVWLGGTLADDTEVTAWLAFHTGARRLDAPGTADFVITGPDALPPLSSLALGTDEAPHQSASVVLDTRGRTGPVSRSTAPRFNAPRFNAPRFNARGPGIDGTATLTAPWAPAGFADAWLANTQIFPRGVDLLLVDADSITALPRTTHLTAS